MTTHVPVALVLFNRPEKTARVFAEIARARPRKLFIVADGPRPDVPEDAARCLAARSILERIDWDCEVLTNVAERNMGCKSRIASGLTWVFENVEEAIVLEDDCLPHPSFFPFCAALLERYRDDERVSMISGNNFQRGTRRTEESYYFSRYTHVWGWATWRRAWRTYDPQITNWPLLRRTRWIMDTLGDKEAAYYWRRIFDLVHAGRINTWDYQWTFSSWLQNGLSASPEVNLVSNIGFGDEATHTKGKTGLEDLAAVAIPFPIRHPRSVTVHAEADRFAFRNAIALDALPRTLFQRVRDRILRAVRRHTSEAPLA